MNKNTGVSQVNLRFETKEKGYCYRHDYDYKINGEVECKYCKEEDEKENAYDLEEEK